MSLRSGSVNSKPKGGGLAVAVGGLLVADDIHYFTSVPRAKMGVLSLPKLRVADQTGAVPLA